MIPPPIKINGPKFWAITAIISVFCTLPLFMSRLTTAVGFRPWDGGPFPRSFIDLIFALMTLMFLVALSLGIMGMGTMILCGVGIVGRIEVRGKLLPAWVMPLFCGAAYAAPWAQLVLIHLTSGID